MAITNPTRGATTNQLKQWWTNTYNVWQSNPAEFQAWASANPDMATRWYAWAQNDGQNLTRDGQRVTPRELQAENMALLQAAGVDLKKDGRLYTTNFNTVDDVNNNWGPGDFWKIGSYNTPRNGVTGLLQNVAESPAAIAGIALAVAMPYLAPQLATAIASATGWSATAAATAAQSVLSAGMSAAQGGDLSDIITAGVTSALPGLSREVLPQVLNSISPATAEAYNSLVAAGPTTMEQGQQVWNNLPSIRDIRGVIDPHIPQGDQPTGVKYDMPILNPVVAEPSPEGASGGSTAPSGGTQTPPATSVPPGTPNAPQSPTGPYKGTAGGLDGVPSDQRWTWNGKELVNVATGRTKAVLGNRTMNKGVIYNEEGDPIGGDETSGLDLGYLVWAATQGAQNGNQGGGGLVLGPGAGPGPGGVGPGTGPGTSPGPGSGPDPGGPGTGQTDNGTGNEPTDTGFDWSKLIPLLALAAPQENNEGVPQGRAFAQDMSTLYQKPTYGPVQQKGLLEPLPVSDRTLQAPSVTPASNSGQATFQQWYQDWLRGQGQQDGLLPMVTPSTRGLV